MSQYTLRKANQQEMSLIIDWASAEGWNPGIHDAATFYQADPGGFFVGRLDDQIISTGSCVNYNDRFSFLGLYIVKPEYRGLGYGMRLTEHLLEHAGDRLIGLDGVLNNIQIYENIGFKYYYENKRYLFKAVAGSSHPDIFDAKAIPFSQLKAYDASCFPAPRDSFLQAWIHQDDSKALAFIKDNQLMGYGVRRKCLDGHKIGPLFANTPFIAEMIFLALNQDVEGENIYLDIPEINQPAVDMAKEYGMKTIFGCARMYNGLEPEIDQSKVFGVTSFELG